MKLSVVIITKNRPMELKDCLDSIENQECLPYEIIIVDSSTTNETRDLITRYLNLNIIYFDHFNGGTSKARNYGFENTQGDIIAFIDDDVILHQEYIKEIINYFMNNSDVGAITGPTYDLSDIILSNSSGLEMNNLLHRNELFFKAVVKEVEVFSGRPFDYFYKKHLNNKFKRIFVKLIRTFFILDSFKLGKMLPSGFGSTFYPLSKPYDVERLNGCNMAFRKKVLSEYKFNEGLEKASNYAIYEDHELGYRISQQYRISMVPTVMLCHRKTPTSRVDSLNYYEAIITNAYFIVKNDLGHLVNKLAFIWSCIGILCAFSALYIRNPSKENKDKLKGTFNGIKGIFSCK